MSEESPKPTGNASVVDLSKMLLPFQREQPCLLNVPGSEFYYLPVFENEVNMREFLAADNITFNRIKQVQENVPEFLQSLTGFPLKLMVNPYYINGRLRWVEIDPAQAIQEWQSA